MSRVSLLTVPLLVVLLSGCSGELDAAEVPLPVLANEPAAHDGSRIVTQGVVRHFDDPLHYWIEDEDLHRVEIFPHDEIAPHLDQRVRVRGQFEYSSSEGRRLTLESVTPLADSD